MKSHNNENVLQTMNNAIISAPGFARLVWNAANKLHEAWNANKELKNWEETHKSKTGSAYNRLAKRQYAAHDSFVTAIESAEIVLGAFNQCEQVDDYSLHLCILEEVSELAKAVSYSEAYSHAHGYVSPLALVRA